MNILVVEDEKKMANFIKRGLREEKYSADVVYNGEAALQQVDSNNYDLIILDIMLPGKDGIFICKELRKKKKDIAILMVTARDAVDDKVIGLNVGADDYLTKPFAFEEFLARVRSLLRRTNNQQNTKLKIADLQLDQVSHKVIRSGKEICLTNKEYALLEYFMLNIDQIVTRTMISEHVWNEDFDSFTNVIDVYVRYLRNKIDKGFKPALLHTIRGTGYILSKNFPCK